MEGGTERQNKRGRERFDLDVWPQQPAEDGDMRVKERDRQTRRGSKKEREGWGWGSRVQG